MLNMQGTPIGNQWLFQVVSTTDAVVLPAANKRRTVTLCNPSALTITVAFGTVVVVNQGINVPGNQNPFCFVRNGSITPGFEIGSLIDQELHAISTGASHVTVIVTYDQDG